MEKKLYILQIKFLKSYDKKIVASFFYPQFISFDASLNWAKPIQIASAISSLTFILYFSFTKSISACFKLVLLIPRPVFIPIEALQELGYIYSIFIPLNFS